MVAIISIRRGDYIGKPIVTEQQRQYIISQYYFKTISALAKELGLKECTVASVWSKAGLRGKSSYTYPLLHNDYFDVIDSPDKAYYLGFICSDGCIYRSPSGDSQARIRICIHKKDERILYQFRSAIGTEKPINHRSGKYSIIEISSNQLVNAIESMGITTRKTWGNCVPIGIPKPLMRYFIRGYFDGDGAITDGGSSGGQLADINISISGYSGNLMKIAKHLESVNIHSSFIEDKRKEKYNEGLGEFGSLCLTNKIDKYCFSKYIYDDISCPYLERKYKTARRFMDIIEKEETNIHKIATKYYRYAVCSVG